MQVIANGLPASPGAASGKVVFTGLITSNLTILNTKILSEGIYLLSAGDNIKRKFIIIR